MLKRLLTIVRWMRQPAVSDRVVLIEDVVVYDLGRFPRGATGIVMWTAQLPDPGTAIATVRFDQPFAALAEWRNELQIWAWDSPGEVTWASFAKLPRA